MAKRPLPAGVVRVVERRQSGASGVHAGSTRTRGAEKRNAIRSSLED